MNLRQETAASPSQSQINYSAMKIHEELTYNLGCICFRLEGDAAALPCRVQRRQPCRWTRPASTLMNDAQPSPAASIKLTVRQIMGAFKNTESQV